MLMRTDPFRDLDRFTQPVLRALRAVVKNFVAVSCLHATPMIYKNLCQLA